MKFKNEDLYEQTHKTVSDEITGTSRWATEYARVFEHDGKLYMYCYDRPATECQEVERDWNGETECPEVVAVERMTTVYEPIGE